MKMILPKKNQPIVEEKPKKVTTKAVKPVNLMVEEVVVADTKDEDQK